MKTIRRTKIIGVVLIGLTLGRGGASLSADQGGRASPLKITESSEQNVIHEATHLVGGETMKSIDRAEIVSMALIGLLFGLGDVSLAADQGTAAGPGNVVSVEKTRVTAQVKAIDKANRLVTLQTPDGETRTIEVPEEARNFDQIKVGDKVTIDYLQTVAVAIRKAGEPKPPSDRATVEVAPKGEKPSGRIVKTHEMTANVEAVDPAKHTVTLKGPEGNSQTFSVDPQVKLEKINVGDKVDVQYTEALALKVTSPS
ncbi:MAG: DUF1344 domain-containing protein [Nitrospirae bacterium]|nr:DUF1344 domain-containing protein [Candidatus Manganitrophaceae bacterium]